MEHHTLEQHHEGSLRKKTPLPKVQLFTLLYLQLAEPITFTVILPFIVKVSTKPLCFANGRLMIVRQLIDETGITGGNASKVGYYAGLVVCRSQDIAPLRYSLQARYRNRCFFSQKPS
jgi:hypothetical protein